MILVSILRYRFKGGSLRARSSAKIGKWASSQHPEITKPKHGLYALRSGFRGYREVVVKGCFPFISSIEDSYGNHPEGGAVS